MKKLLLILLCLPFIFSNLKAQSLYGNWGCELNGNQITLFGEKITHYDNSMLQGTLKISLYATDYIYNGGAINGHELFQIELDPANRIGSSYVDISETGYLSSLPSNNNYFLTIILFAYNQIVDYRSVEASINWFDQAYDAAGGGTYGNAGPGNTGYSVDWSKVDFGKSSLESVMNSAEASAKRTEINKLKKDCTERGGLWNPITSSCDMESLKRRQQLNLQKKACKEQGEGFIWIDDLQLCDKIGNKKGVFYGDCVNRYGIYVYENGTIYNGEWKEGAQHGEGTYTWANGDTYTGEWKEGAQHGEGTYTLASGSVYIGKWKKGKKHGKFINICNGITTKEKWKKGVKIK